MGDARRDHLRFHKIFCVCSRGEEYVSLTSRIAPKTKATSAVVKKTGKSGMPVEVSRHEVAGVCKIFRKIQKRGFDAPSRTAQHHRVQCRSYAFVSAIGNVGNHHSGKIEDSGLKDWHAKCKYKRDKQPWHDDVEMGNYVPGGKTQVQDMLCN
jgi:hypothetical protein